MCSYEALKEKISAMEMADKIRDEQNKVDHNRITDALNKYWEKTDKLETAITGLTIAVTGKTTIYDDRYVLKSEFKLVRNVLTIALTVVTALGSYLWIAK